MGINGATRRMRWNLVDDSTLILSTGVGPKVEAEFTIADGKLFLTVDDSTVVYTKG